MVLGVEADVSDAAVASAGLAGLGVFVDVVAVVMVVTRSQMRAENRQQSHGAGIRSQHQAGGLAESVGQVGEALLRRSQECVQEAPLLPLVT